MKRVINKCLDIIFNLYVNTAFFYLKKVYKNKKRHIRPTGIMALPYYSKNYPGGHSRIADWKEYFNKDGIRFEVFWASESESFIKSFHSKNPFKRYLFFFRVLNSRLSIINKIGDYEALWIQRAFVPFYPFKKAKFEKFVSNLHPNITVDFYDADYEYNELLTNESAKYFNQVSVASPYLQKYFLKLNKNTFYLPFAIKHDDYILKTYEKKTKVTIGWMGSPENFENIILIENQLAQVEKLNPHVNFVFICRKSFSINLSRVKFLSFEDPGFDYYKEISSFDIGISPLINQTEENMAKTTFKTLEFMCAGISFISSPWGIPDYLVHDQNVLFAESKDDWVNSLIQLSKSHELRVKLSKNAFETLIKYYSYSKVYTILREKLVKKNEKY